MRERETAPTRIVWSLLALLAVQVVLAAVGAAWWGWRTFAHEDLTGEPPELAADVPRPVTLETAYPLARQRAMEWSDEAKLILVAAQIDWPLDVPAGPVTEPPGGGWLTYVFLRELPGDDQALCLLIERYSGRIVQEIVADWGAPGEVAELDLLALPVSSSVALIVAERAGGTEFRRVCPEARHQTRISLGQAPLDLLEIPSTVLQEASPPAAALPAATPVGDAVAATDAQVGWLLGYRDVRDGGIAPFRVGVDVMTGSANIELRPVTDAEGCPA